MEIEVRTDRVTQIREKVERAKGKHIYPTSGNRPLCCQIVDHDVDELLERIEHLGHRLDEARFAAWVAGCDHTTLRETPDDHPNGRQAADILARLAREHQAENEALS